MFAIVVVTWNSEDVIGRCLDSCLRAGVTEIVVIDNASGDATRAEVQRRSGVRLLASSTNLGFAGAVNLGVSQTAARHILLLNPDTEVLGGLQELEETLSWPGAGAAAGQLVGGAGEAQHGFNVRALPTPSTLVFEALGLNRLWSSSTVNRRYRLRLAGDGPRLVEQPAGAFFAFRRDIWTELGGFDEGFWPAWFEDVDFCKRLLDTGRQIWYVPTARASHAGGNSVRKLSWGDKEQIWYRNLLRYAAKHFSWHGYCMTTVGVIGGSILRAITVSLRRFTLWPLAVYSRVVWVACLQWFSLVGAKPGQPQRIFSWKGLQQRN